ncbi:hypothetical protein B0H10DRAFT_2074056 [Mycena sp. CBHHK59/15]|nr:hypothetical protein B0H10DRAFT_2074056 [Mycena sp. CBHHK59/15]
MAPERFDPGVTPTKESDVYSFAHLVYEIFENKAPFHEIEVKNDIPDLWKLLHMVRSANPSGIRPSSLMSDVLWNIVERCMSRRPADRPQMKDLKKEMRPLAKDLILC